MAKMKMKVTFQLWLMMMSDMVYRNSFSLFFVLSNVIIVL